MAGKRFIRKPVEAGEVLPEVNYLHTADGQSAVLSGIAADIEAKPLDRISAVKALMELFGTNKLKGIEDIKRLPQDELEAIIWDLRPVFRHFEVQLLEEASA